ncbi:hypothetical protein PTRA_a1480 [Pseudoalteromonas translucida KMM 520]|uniref:Large polyvalent protein-associated domain-containing protein n=1 Tax=Pseudoalteromonas translucida KMM 520 TaxID=1315283 RepID=A0A0U2ISF2_9GAMM|nr:LPD5 domain-containing protein [Pseudoalteromonas translucida]ALS32687.1 hypothetical protein PTRA_a1480 [Pseudoalteromonas translucida KMM 520]
MTNKIVDPFTNKEIEFVDPFAEPETKSGMAAAFGAGVDKVEELGYRAVKGFTDTGENPDDHEEGSFSQSVAKAIGKGGSVSKWAQEGIDRNVKEQEAYEPTVKSYKDIDGFGDAASYTGELLAGSLPYMAGAATGIGALGMAGGLSHEAYEKQPEGEKDAARAVTSGAAQMLLERLGIKVSMGQLGKDILKDGVVETAKRMGKGELVDAVRDPSFAKRIFKGAVGEGLTETGQEALAQWGAGKSIDEFEGLDEAFVGGFAVGGVMRTGSESAQKVMGYQKKTAEAVKQGVDQLVEAGASHGEAIDTVRKQQYDAAKKQGLSEAEASAVVARTMKEKFGIDDPLFAAAAEPVAVESVEAGMEPTIPEDTQTPIFQNDEVDFDAPTAARQAGFDQTNKAAGQYGDMLTSPAQQSLSALDAGNNAPTVDERVKAAAFDKSPTPEDRFSPIKYQHEGDLLGPEAQDAQSIDNAPIDGQTVPEQGKLPTAEQTQSRQMREQAQVDLESQPKSIEQKDIIFGEDGRPQQRAAQQVKQAGKDSQNLLPQKDIIFADDNSGVNVSKNGEPFKTKRGALLSKEARAARRAGQKTKAVSFDNGFGWEIKGSDISAAPNAAPDISADNTKSTQPAASLAGEPIDSEWTVFNQQSETKNIPRAEMPQIKAENRGALVNFMKARDISHEQDEVAAASLKPTQQEFSPAKVKKAMEFEGGNRSILVSNDGYVLDGHHQWLAAREKGEPVKVTRLNAPIEQLVPLAKEMPSTETQGDNSKLITADNDETAISSKLNTQNDTENAKISKLNESAEPTAPVTNAAPKLDRAEAELPAVLKVSKTKWLQSQAKEQGLKKGSPGFDVAMAKIEEGYEPAIDRALAESSFETYKKFNDDTPESINRMAHKELRKEFGIDDTPPPIKEAVKPAKKTEPPKSGFSLPENRNVNGMAANEIEAIISKTSNDLATTSKEDWGNLRGQGKRVGGMVMGGMRDSSLQGEKAYTNVIGKLEQESKADYDDAIATFNDDNNGKIAYGKARSAGFDHDTSLRYGLSKVANIGMTFDELLNVESNNVGDNATPKTKGGTNPDESNQATVKQPASEPDQASPQESIDDFGEKLGGARKDAWSGFSEAIQDQQNTAELPLSKAWPEPNYKELASTGASLESIALMAAMRSEIPSKPRVARKVARWAKTVNDLKEFAADLMSGDRDIATVMQSMRNHSSKLAAVVDAIPSIAKADIDTLKNVADYRISSGSFSVFGGKTYSPSKVFYFIERNGRPVYDGASETLSDVQALLTKVVKAEQSDTSNATSGKKSKISVYRDRYTKDVYLGWKGAGGVLKIKSFDDLGTAREYLKNNREEVEQTLQKMKETPSMRKPVNAERAGPERYAGNVTPETFSEAFGFRGVEFGNWVEQAKRQKDLNQAYDGLIDLAEALDIPPKALSLNGKLGLAFGARGKGGKNPAAAHYEPNSVVINLTKKAGSGSLAHEWWHALDNYFGKQRANTDFITESPYTLSTDEIRPEMASAFKHVRNAIVQSGLPERSKQLDTRRSKAYWATTIEMTARSFETYIIDKLSQQGIENDYLANVLADDAWTAAESLGFESSNSYPYPNKAEQQGINAAYQTLFDTIESENTSEGIRLFSKSKNLNTSKSISAEKAQGIADEFVKSLKGANGITVSILEDTATAEKLWRMSLDGATVKGAYSENSKTVYVIAENIDSESDLKKTLAHETIAHGGLDTVIGADAKQAFIDRIKATKGRKAFEKYWKDANNDYWDASQDVKAEEIFARFVENEPTKGELKYWWQALKRFIRAQLDKVGLAYSEDTELTAMREMLESIVKGFKAQREPMTSSQTEMAYSQSDKKFSHTTSNGNSQTSSKISEAIKKAINRESRFEKSRMPEWEALNAQLRETDKTTGSKIKRQLSRWIMPGGNMPETVKQAVRGRDRDVAVHEFDISMLVGKLNSAIKSASINPDRLTDDQWAKYHQFLTGENNGSTLGQSERDVLVLMREHIDGLTRDYVASVNNKLQQRLAEDGVTDPKEAARLEKMLGNVGKYLNRSYKAFDDKEWFKKIPTKVIDDARTYLINQYKRDGHAAEEAQNKAQVTLNEIVKTGTAYESLGSFIAESKLGSKDLSTLIPRKDISPEIRALLGEYADPRINYAKSVSKMSSMIASDKLLSTIRDMGINNFIFEKDTRPPEATVQLAGEKSEVYSPLNGMWTTPEIKEAFEDAMGTGGGEGWLDTAIRINGFIKYGKTVLSPTTAMRNVMSSYFFTVANGHFNQKYMKQAVSAFNAQVKGKVTDGESDYIKRLIKLGVLYDSANAGEMVKMMTDGKISQMLEGKGGAAFESLRWLTDKATGFYRFGDDFWKIVGFENEKAALIRTGMPQGEAESVAAERIQDTYPTYSRVGKAGVWLSRFPLAGTFVSFPAEIVRTTGNMIKLAASEIKSDNPKVRAMGAKRIVGITMASGGMFALSALSAAMFGVTDDEEEALRDMTADWQKNSTFVYAGRDSDGNLRYFDMSFLDPYGYWKRPIEAMMRDQPVDKAIASSLSDMISPFLGADITAGKILEVLSNKKQSGGQVYKENDTAIRKSADIAGYLALGLAPGAVNNAWRIGMAAGDVKRSTGKPYSLPDEMLALMGFRSSTFDPKVSLYYRTFDFNSSIAEARKELSGVLRDPNKVSDGEISAAKDRAKSKQEQAFKQMSRLIQAAQTGGASRPQVVRILLLAGISKRNVGFLLQGRVPPVNLSDTSYESAVKRAQLIMDNESAREIRSRFNRITSKD